MKFSLPVVVYSLGRACGAHGPFFYSRGAHGLGLEVNAIFLNAGIIIA